MIKLFELSFSFKEKGVLSVKAIFLGEYDKIGSYVTTVIKHVEEQKKILLDEPETIGVIQSEIGGKDLFLSELSFETKVVLE